ncbi:GtrA family protein [Corynebacterium flavescens]|uniref:GtrA family protein n=1 Tax=Corynebacterium flavescens TaxID=28028 RepID=UPI0030158171
MEVQASSTSLKTQLFRFSSVGGCTAALDYRRTQHLTALGLHRSAAKALGWVAGTIAAYIANARWTFGAQVSGRTAGAVAALYGSTFVVQNFLYWVLNAPLLSLGLDGVVKDTVAFVIAQAVATVTNFVIQRIFIFKDK